MKDEGGLCMTVYTSRAGLPAFGALRSGLFTVHKHKGHRCQSHGTDYHQRKAQGFPHCMLLAICVKPRSFLELCAHSASQSELLDQTDRASASDPSPYA